MPKYDVEVEFISKKTISVHADDEEQAEEKAAEVIQKWDNVMDVTETTCEGLSNAN